MKTLNKKTILLFFITLLGGFFRFYNLNWDQGHYLHPDERLYGNASNISFPKSLSEFLSPNSPLNPHMFYYGSFPLYLYKLVNVFILPFLSFDLTGRIFSAFFSIISIVIIYRIGKNLIGEKAGIFSAIIFAFSAGSIQHAHFDTTESVLVFFQSLIILLSIKLIQKKSLNLLIILGVLVGLSFATKIIGLTFAFFPLIAIGYLFFKEKTRSRLIAFTILFGFLAILIGVLFTPYQLIDYSSFKREQDFMQSVIYGKDKPPFTIIYEGSLPYIYPIISVLPFSFGFISLPLALLGLFWIIKSHKKNFILSLISIYPLLYFLWAGAWYAKFSRYYIILFPFLALWAGYALSKLPRKVVTILLVVIVLNGAFFIKIYLSPNPRIQASAWIYQNLSTNQTISGEHWDDNLPLPLPGISNMLSYNMIQLEVYNPDSPEKISQLARLLTQSDYFIISSRRVYQSILNNKKLYPYTSNFYKQLFAHRLGFVLEKKFTNYPYFFSDDFADESFQSYDHPPVLIYKNQKHLNPEQLTPLIKNK